MLQNKRPPGPKGYPIIGILPQLSKGSIFYIHELYQEFGDIMEFKAGPRVVTMIRHPDQAKQILVDKAKHYNKGWDYQPLELLLGQGLLTLEGAEWRSHRKIVNPTFAPESLRSFVPIFVDATDKMFLNWEKSTREGRPVDLNHDMLKLTLEITSRAFFGSDLGDLAGMLEKHFPDVADFIYMQLFAFTPLMRYLPSPAKFRFDRAMKLLDNQVYELIAEREGNPGRFQDLLSALILAREEDTGAKLNREELRNEVMVLLMAGHETTSNVLAFTLWLLQRYPKVLGQLREEVDSVLRGGEPDLEKISQMPYCRMIIEETMRLYPPAYWLSRTPKQADEISGYAIPKDSLVGLSAYSLHRHPDFWENPEEFIPERFEAAKTRSRHKCAFIPFGAGPRICVGKTFAMMEIPIVISKIVQRWDLQLEKGQNIKPWPRITLRPNGPIYTLLRSRKSSIQTRTGTEKKAPLVDSPQS